MAEGIFKAKTKNKIQVYSAGTNPLEVHPLAICTLREMQIDISGQHAKPLSAFLDQEFDYVITVCDRARDTCPIFCGSPKTIHWSLPDPLEANGNDEERLDAFRTVAKDISLRIDYFLARISFEHNP
jgi:arsenate reductase